MMGGWKANFHVVDRFPQIHHYKFGEVNDCVRYVIWGDFTILALNKF